jgi:hypothetical protein
MTYTKLRQQCFPQTSAITRDNDFISPNVQPYYISVPLNSQKQPPSCEAGAPCSKSGNWSNDPKQWGPHLWFYLHTAAMNYPLKPSSEQQKGMKEWLCSLKWTIPCKDCSNHYGSYIESHKSELNSVCSNRDSLFEFLVKIHNKVNARSGKPIISVEDAKKMYVQF